MTTIPATTTATAAAPTADPRDTSRPIVMRGLTVRPRVTAAQSGGTLSILEQVVEPGAGSPPHQCLGEHKVITVLEGFFAVRNGDDKVAAVPGDSVVIPPGATHNFVNRGSGTGRVLVTLTPGGHEEFLRGLAEMGGPANADPVELAGHCAQFGVHLGEGRAS